MHLSIDRLLTIRDSEPTDVAHLEHLRGCDECSQALVVLREQRAKLQSLSDIDPPADAWVSINATKLVSKPMQQHKYRVTAIAVSVVLVAVTAITLLRQPDSLLVNTQQALLPKSQPESLSQSMINLVAQSQELESLLYELPHRPHVEQADTAATIDELEAQIQFLDVQLSNVEASADVVVSYQHSEQLWRQRVELMATLVNVRYAQASRFYL